MHRLELFLLIALAAVGLPTLASEEDAALRRLEDQEEIVRMQALEYFQEHVRPEHLETIAERTADPSNTVFNALLYLLQAWNLPERTVPVILDRLAAADGAWERRRCFDALDRIVRHGGLPERHAGRMARYLDHPDLEVRTRTAALLGPGRTAALAILMKALGDHDPALRRKAAGSLAGSLYRPKDAGLVRSLLHDEDPDVRRHGVDLAARLPREDAREVFREVIDSPDTGEAVLSRALSLFPAGDAEDAVLLIEIGRTHESDLVRVNAIIALSILETRTGSSAGDAWYREILRDHDASPGVLAAAVNAVRWTGDPSFLPLLADRLRRCPVDRTFLGNNLVETISILIGRRLHDETFGTSGEAQ